MTVGWKIYWLDSRDEKYAHPRSGTWAEIHDRERVVGISFACPVFVNPSAEVDRRLSQFCRRSRFAALSMGTRRTYATDYRLFFDFLWDRGLDWSQVSEDDIRDWHNWRRIDPESPHRVGGAKWNRELAALRVLYRWAYKRGHTTDPLFVLNELASRDARSFNVKWLTPRAYEKWRDVGLLGYAADGSKDTRFRGRESDRNRAFADLVFTTGMRLREAGSLLNAEVPDYWSSRYARIRVADATAKARGYIVYAPATALSEVSAYVESTRAEAVRGAQAKGHYSRLPDLLLVDKITAGDQIIWRDRAGATGSIHLLNADAQLRRRLYRMTDSGLEPLALWLDQTGAPLDYESWKKIFRQASDRCARHGLKLRCTPHMLRHSFALHMLVSLNHAFDRRLGLTPEERRYYRETYGDVWSIVRDMLGHRDDKTTKDIYLEPVRGLQLDTILNEANEEDVDALLSRIANDTGLVMDAP